MDKPYISFVAMARNDDYGGNWINRINAFMKVLAYQAGRTRLPCELVFVEYNPVAGKPNLYKELTVPKNDFFRVRFIVVPNEFHKSLPDNDRVQICEFIAKNIAVRRSLGEFIIGTNPDILYGDDLFNFFASKELRGDVFYRINRKDLSTDFVEPSLTGEEALKNADRRVTKIMYNNQTVYVSYLKWLDAFIHGRNFRIFMQSPIFNNFRKPKTDNSVIHENAAGDFLLMHRNVWEKVSGYDQMTVGSGIMDGYIMYSLYCLGFKQQILSYSIFHLNHHHGGVKYLASHAKFRADAKKMLETRIPYKINAPDWGFPNMKFEEIKF